MFAKTPVARAIGTYGMFLKTLKGNPKFAMKNFRAAAVNPNKPDQKAHFAAIAKRSKMVAEAYRALTPEQMAALKKRAVAHPNLKRRKLKNTMNPDAKPRKASPYNLFFKKRYASVRHLPNLERAAAIAKLWLATKAGGKVAAPAKKVAAKKH